MSERPKALIVGAGPTGLVMAHELARDGIQCCLVVIPGRPVGRARKP
jgi:cation diffusion facilitator CzcD-associated flavoprotein CzcO